jgi:hypothetical protein
MTPEQQAAYILSQVACMQAELAAMQVANQAAGSVGTLKYSEQDFLDLPLKYGVHHNAVIGYFQS